MQNSTKCHLNRPGTARKHLVKGMRALFGNILIFWLNLIRSIIQALAVTSNEIMVKQIFIWDYYIFVDSCSVEYSRRSSSDPLLSIYNPDNALLIPVLTYNTSGAACDHGSKKLHQRTISGWSWSTLLNWNWSSCHIFYRLTLCGTFTRAVAFSEDT